MRTRGQPEYKAAWVPDDDPRRPWDDALEPAIDWVEEQCLEQNAPALLVTITQHVLSAGPPALADFAARHAATTPRGARAGSRGSPVLVYVPDEVTFLLAARYARHSALCVVESSQTPLIGWAMETGAINLLTGEPTMDNRPEELQEAMETLLSYGNNGWTRGFGADAARRILTDLRSKGLLDRDTILGYVLAHDVSSESVKRLEKLIEQA